MLSLMTASFKQDDSPKVQKQVKMEKRTITTRQLMLIVLYILLIFLLLLTIARCLRQQRIYRWEKNLKIPQHAANFHSLYEQMNGFSLSRQARKHNDALDYIYGEIDFTSFIALLSLVKPNSHSIFYDLGSGIGKAVVACAMVYPVRKSVGIELLPALHQAASQQKEQLAADSAYLSSAEKIDFILGDFLTIDLHEANLIFINSSTLFGTTWDNLCALLDTLPHAHTLITTSKPLKSTVFSLQITTQVQMSWGVVPAYIHIKKQNSTNPLENIE